MSHITTEMLVREILENEPDNTVFGEVLASTLEYSNKYVNLTREQIVDFIKAKRTQLNNVLNGGILFIPKATERMVAEAKGEQVFNHEDV